MPARFVRLIVDEGRFGQKQCGQRRVTAIGKLTHQRIAMATDVFLAVLSGEKVKLSLSDANSSVLLEETEDGDSLYVVMPMRL